MNKFKCVSYLDKLSKYEFKDYVEAFAKDFAQKLLIVYKNNKTILQMCPPRTLIYEYFHREFPQISVYEYDDGTPETLDIIDPTYSKEICKKVFEDNGEIFNQNELGGGEWPFIKLYKTKVGYFYNITR